MKKRVLSILLLLIVCCTSIQATNLNLKSIYTSGMSTKVNQSLVSLNQQYSEITELVDIGYSAVQKIPIKALKLGKGEKCILINGAHHARESLTTILVLAQIEDLAEAYTKNETRHGYKVRQLLDTISIYFVPMVNPDGIELAMSQKPSWKANGRGVDLNRNYPTLYAKTVPTRYPGAQGYAGPYPFSEPETQAIRDLCEAMQFETAIAYHSAGQIIYWWYYQTGNLYNRSLVEAKLLASITGYSLVPISQQRGGLGFTDWFIQYYKRPGYTIEIGQVANSRPLAWSEYTKVWKNNKDVPLHILISIIQNETKDWATTIAGKNIKGEAVFGRGMVPLREIKEALAVNITYDSTAKKIEVSRQGDTLSLTLGEKTAFYNGEMIELVMPAYAKNGITYLPLRDLLIYFSEKKDVSVENEVIEAPNTGTEGNNIGAEENNTEDEEEATQETNINSQDEKGDKEAQDKIQQNSEKNEEINNLNEIL